MLRSFVRPAGKVAGRVRVVAEGAAPKPEDFRRVDEAIAQAGPNDPEVAPWFENYVAVARERLAFDLGFLREYSPLGARVLDLGAVPPVLCGAAASVGFAVQAVDIAPARFEAAFERLGVEALACDLEREDLPVEDASIDTAVLHEVFEHLRVDPIHVCEQIARVLKPGGILMLSTPNLLSLSGMVNLLLRGRAQTIGTDPWSEYGKLRTLGHMGHVREYTTVEVCEFLERFGLQAEVLVFRGRSPGVKRPITSALPPLRPFFEVIARRS